jgi:hypothetical protein
MTPAERSQLGNAQNSPARPRRFQDERDIELVRSAGRNAGRFNRIGRLVWWQGHDVNATLAEYGYRPRVNDDPPRAPSTSPCAVHGTGGTASTEAASKNHVGPLALWLVEHRWTHTLGRASFCRRRRS